MKVLALLCLALTSCQTVRDIIPPSPLKVCPVRWLAPADGRHREYNVTLYSRQW